MADGVLDLWCLIRQSKSLQQPPRLAPRVVFLPPKIPSKFCMQNHARNAPEMLPKCSPNPPEINQKSKKSASKSRSSFRARFSAMFIDFCQFGASQTFYFDDPSHPKRLFSHFHLFHFLFVFCSIFAVFPLIFDPKTRPKAKKARQKIVLKIDTVFYRIFVDF